MKLIHGKIHDYYDCIAKYGHDTHGNTFVRNPETITIQTQRTYTVEKGWHWDTPDHPLNFMLTDSVNYHEEKYRFSNKKIATIETFKILFCGKLYKGLKIKLDDNRTTHYCYDVDSVKEVFLVNETELPEKDLNKGNWSWRQKDFLNVKSLLNYFEVSNHSDTAISNKFVIAILSTISRNTATIQLNSNLSEYEFYKVLDSYTAYQTLSMYVDGSLSYPGNIPQDIPDEYKIESKGFDPEYGFRTRPKS